MGHLAGDIDAEAGAGDEDPVFFFGVITFLEFFKSIFKIIFLKNPFLINLCAS